ncbi:GAF and ANTAR domain-containing protein [Isoptericola hypogeus]|uniref:GAF and ANTAR domain-containing protein n=1 Tax=Isoptericola hypogeus TaxID=300179 RepID=UPI0031E2F623
MDPTELLGLLARSLARVDADRPLPLRLCEACVEILRAQGAALTVATPGDRLAVSTPGAFEQLEPLQEVLGEGPVHQAMAEDRPVVVRIDGGSNDYPVFSQLAGSVGGDVTIHAVPMRAGGRVVGVISLYVTAGRLARSADDVQFLADAVGTSLLGDVETLDWSERSRVHQATGMVVAQLKIPPDDALAVIRAHAFARAATLQSVADDVLHRRLTFSHDEPTDDATDRTEEP